MDDFFEKLNKNVSKAAEKMDVWTQVGKLKLDQKKLESRLKKHYGEFGKKIYRMYGTEGYSEVKKDDVSADIEQIEEIIKEQENLKEKIELLKAEPDNGNDEKLD